MKVSPYVETAVSNNARRKYTNETTSNGSSGYSIINNDSNIIPTAQVVEQIDYLNLEYNDDITSNINSPTQKSSNNQSRQSLLTTSRQDVLSGSTSHGQSFILNNNLNNNNINHRPNTSSGNPTYQDANNNAFFYQSPTIEEIMRNDETYKWNEELRLKVINSIGRKLNEDRAKQFLTGLLWPNSLQNSLIKSTYKLPIRFFIVDDSGSMSESDGKRVLKSGPNCKVIQCTRWAELTDSLRFHAELSNSLGSLSEFRLLNSADPVLVGFDDNGRALQFANDVFDENPNGQTPLCEHISKVAICIDSIAKELKSNNQKATVVICTDGLATDGNVIDAMRPLQRLPVWVILRLCTNEQSVVEFWNNIDKELELEIDVIDDHVSEASEIFKVNNWLTYGEPLHRFREFGINMREIDLIDEKLLGKEQMRDVCALFLTKTGNTKEIPHPDADWSQFLQSIRSYNQSIPQIYCTVDRRFKPWIDIDRLKQSYGSKDSCCSIS